MTEVFLGMGAGFQELKSYLLVHDEEFSRLAREHSDYEHRLEQLSGKSYLTDSEQMEEINLKKRKLSLKDRMEQILQRHRSQSVA